MTFESHSRPGQAQNSTGNFSAGAVVFVSTSRVTESTRVRPGAGRRPHHKSARQPLCRLSASLTARVEVSLTARVRVSLTARVRVSLTARVRVSLTARIRVSLTARVRVSLTAASESASQPASESASQPASESASQPVSESASLPASESAAHRNAGGPRISCREGGSSDALAAPTRIESASEGSKAFRRPCPEGGPPPRRALTGTRQTYYCVAPPLPALSQRVRERKREGERCRGAAWRERGGGGWDPAPRPRGAAGASWMTATRARLLARLLDDKPASETRDRNMARAGPGQ